MTRQFPIALDDVVKSIPWHLLEPHAAQAIKNHGKTLETLAAQGGLSPEEALAIIEARPWERMGFSEARRQLLDYVAGASGSAPPAAEGGDTLAADLEAVISTIKAMRDSRSGVSRWQFNKVLTTLERARGRV